MNTLATHYFEQLMPNKSTDLRNVTDDILTKMFNCHAIVIMVGVLAA